jgi:hypothetical protein
MRLLGGLLLLVGLGSLAYALFALAWDSGARANDDRVVAGLSVLLAIGGAGLIARRRWGLWISGAVGVAVVALIVLASIARVPTPSMQDSGPVRLQDLPADPARVATRLDAAWWATSIDDLRKRQDDAITRNWAIQGDGNVRLIVPRDPTRDVRDGNFVPLLVFLVIRSPNGTAVTSLFDDFYSDNREAPVRLTLDKTKGTVVARSSRVCFSRSFTVDPAAGAVTDLGNPVAC